jgi:hypothetical protein
MYFEENTATSQYVYMAGIGSFVSNNRLLNGLPSKSKNPIHLLRYLG